VQASCEVLPSPFPCLTLLGADGLFAFPELRRVVGLLSIHHAGGDIQIQQFMLADQADDFLLNR